MKRLRRIAVVAGVSFLAFAPPGTLIVIAAILVGLFGTGWSVVAAAGLLATTALIWVARRRRRPGAGSPGRG